MRREHAWRGPRDPEEAEETRGGWWAWASRIAGGPEVDGAQPDPASKSKRELYKEAKRAGIEGRSSMNKAQLVEALRRHQATAASPEPPPRPVPEPARRTSARRPPLSGRRQPDARKAERCAIAYEVSDGQGEFQVVAIPEGGSPTVAARSPAFAAPSGELRRSGAVRAAHELLVKRLVVAGWWPVDGGAAWPEIQFVRVRPAAEAGGRVLVTVVRDAGRAHFVAEQLDGYGNPAPLIRSDPFRSPRLLPVRASRQAKAALADVVERLEHVGWSVAEHVGHEWYSLSLWRARAAR
jgi:hypothetical protein